MSNTVQLSEGDTFIYNGVTYTVTEDIEVEAELVNPSPIPNQGGADPGS